MERPTSLWLVTLVLATYGALAVWAAVTLRDARPAGGGVLALGAATGLFFGQRWARFLVYLVALLVAVSWGYSVWILAWAGWPFQDPTGIVGTLVPGALLIVVLACSSVLVSRYFRRPSG
jgi:hypothetical protein